MNVEFYKIDYNTLAGIYITGKKLDNFELRVYEFGKETKTGHPVRIIDNYPHFEK